jgi:hypothetical protein
LKQTVLEFLYAVKVDDDRKSGRGQAQDQVPRVDQWRRNLVNEDVAHDAAADAAGVAENDDADDGEVPVVVGTAGE